MVSYFSSFTSRAGRPFDEVLDLRQFLRLAFAFDYFRLLETKDRAVEQIEGNSGVDPYAVAHQSG